MKRMILAYFWAEAPRWVLWWPVGMGLGIFSYFCLPHEPTLIFPLIILGLASLLTWYLWHIQLARFPLLLVISILVGINAAKIRTERVDTIMLEHSIKSIDINGQVLELDYRHNRWRCLLQIYESTPLLPFKKIRVNINTKPERLTVGAFVRIIADLYPIPFPISPSGFNFRQQAYFQGIGATGRIVEIIEINRQTAPPYLSQLRQTLNHTLLDRLPPHPASLAIAFVTGERGYIQEKLRQDFINAGLAHLLAISGLHLGLLAGIVFLIIRRGLGLYPLLLEKYNVKKVAAALSIPLVFFYLALSSWGLPAQRAFIMISIIMLAIIYDYQAISMRLIAFAATIILLLQPESLLNASFQLSFAAVIGLIAFYEKGWQPLQQWYYQGGIIRRLTSYFIGLTATTLVASLATLPFTIAMFNRFTLQALLGNLLAIPLMGLLIMPLLLFMVLFNFAGPIHWLDHLTTHALHWLIAIAQFVSQLPGSAIELSTPAPGFLWCSILGGLWLCLWQQPWRYWGLCLIALSPLFLWFRSVPDLYITPDAIGVTNHKQQTLTIYSKNTSSFLADQWHKETAKYQILWQKNTADFMGNVSLFFGQSSFKNIKQICQKSQILIFLGNGQNPCYKINPQAVIIDRSQMRAQGNYFIWLNNPMKILTTKDLTGGRPWGIASNYF